jgi:thioredoxin-dependent peroxiredoxin
MRLALSLALFGSLTLAGCLEPAKRPDGGVGPLPVGAPAPEVVGHDVEENEVRLSAQRGNAAVVYFYPKDGTPSCTKEACAFRDAWSRYTSAHVAVIGVSSNTHERHAEFLRDEKLPFALASDESGAVAASYGVGKDLFGYDRVTFLIAPDGKVARYWADVDPGLHASEVLEAVEEIRAAEPEAPKPAEPKPAEPESAP